MASIAELLAVGPGSGSLEGHASGRGLGRCDGEGAGTVVPSLARPPREEGIRSCHHGFPTHPYL